MSTPMPPASLDSTYVHDWRQGAVFAGGALLMGLIVAGVLHFPGLPGLLQLAGIVAGFASFVLVLLLGGRGWAWIPVRYELDEGGLSAFGRDGALRERVGWSDMREYVIDTISPTSSIRYLLVVRKHGEPIRIVEPQTPERKRAFQAFCSSFVAAVAVRHASVPAGAVREGVSFYDGAGAHVLGIVMLVLMVGLAVGLLFLPARETAPMLGRLVLVAGASAAFIYRTVFNRTPPTRRPGA
jgi:hypothetical protein